jgi:hypothetical protein
MHAHHRAGPGFVEHTGHLKQSGVADGRGKGERVGWSDRGVIDVKEWLRDDYVMIMVVSIALLRGTGDWYN